MKKILNPNFEIPKLESEETDSTNPLPAQIIDENMEIKHDDEVFVAFIREDEASLNCKDENCEEFEEEKTKYPNKSEQEIIEEIKGDEGEQKYVYIDFKK